jgi:hypothetical protein
MRPSLRHASRGLLCLLGGLIANAATWAAEPAAQAAAQADVQMRFMRVHVPRDGLADVPLGDTRHVPMPREAFEAAVARLTAAPGEALRPDGARADAARYEARIGAEGTLEGRVAFDVGPGAGASVPGVMPLGGLDVTACTATTAAGVGAMAIFGLGDGTSAVATSGAGEYVAEWSSGGPRPTSDGPLYTLPLLPAVRSSIRLQLPPGRRPLLVGHELAPTRAGAAWLIDAGASGSSCT